MAARKQRMSEARSAAAAMKRRVVEIAPKKKGCSSAMADGAKRIRGSEQYPQSHQRNIAALERNTLQVRQLSRLDWHADMDATELLPTTSPQATNLQFRRLCPRTEHTEPGAGRTARRVAS